MWYSNCMNNDLDRNQNDNFTSNEPIASSRVECLKENYISTESSVSASILSAKNLDKKKAFRYVVIYELIYAVTVFAGAYIFGQQLNAPGNNFEEYCVFLMAEFLSIFSVYSSLFLAGLMIVQYRKGSYHYVGQIVKDSLKSALYSVMATAIFLVLLWGADKPVTIITLLFSFAAVFSCILGPVNDASVRRYNIDMSIIDGKIEKKHALLYTAIYIMLCLLVATVVGLLIPIAVIIIALLVYISIKWYRSGRYWIAEYMVKNVNMIMQYYAVMIFYAITVFFLSPPEGAEDKYSIIWLPVSFVFLCLRYIVLISPLLALAGVSWIIISYYVNNRTKLVGDGGAGRSLGQPEYPSGRLILRSIVLHVSFAFLVAILIFLSIMLK